MADAKLTALTETSVAALDDVSYTVDISDTTDDAAGSSRKLSFNRLGGLFIPSYCDGRLTTESGVAVSTSDRTSQGTIYFTPYLGNRITIYDGTRWKLYSFTERSLSLSSLTSGKNYDVFIYDNAGTLTLELSAAWTNDTTRADALTTQDGVYVKSGATTRRWLGTIRTTSTTTTEDSGGGSTTQVGGKRFVWNAYNRIVRNMSVIDTTATWTYNTADWRQANAASGNKVEFVCGIATPIRGTCLSTVNITGGSPAHLGIGLDSTTSSVGIGHAHNSTTSNFDGVLTAYYAGAASAGYHYLAWLEAGYSGANLTWTGQISSGGTAQRQSGLVAEVLG